ncbi:MAG: 4-hydroxy-3-methylbut-2-enyl diphosphate reductase [Bacteroidota bacterium]
MLNLTVSIDSSSGFCFGVVFAIEMAEDILVDEGSLYCLGDIVHNDQEVKRLEAMGLEMISREKLKEIRDAKVLIRAHGEPPETYKIALENNLNLIDASCPVVLKLQNRIRNSFEQEENIFIYGKKDHAEVIGLQGQTRETATVFQSIEELESHSLPESITLYSQTTKNKRSFYDVVNYLEERGTKVKVHDTICRQVSNRDEDLRNFASAYSKILFVAGRKSSNGKMLYQVCRQVNPHSYFISSTEEIFQDWFEPGDTVGICGATSTPQWLMDEVRKKLLTY